MDWRTYAYICTHIPTGEAHTREFIGVNNSPYGHTYKQFIDALKRWNESNPTIWNYKEV